MRLLLTRRPAAPAAPLSHTLAEGPGVPQAELDEISDDELEHVVGGLARTWTEALRAAPARHST